LKIRNLLLPALGRTMPGYASLDQEDGELVLPPVLLALVELGGPVGFLTQNAVNGNQRGSFVVSSRQAFNVNNTRNMFILPDGVWRLSICESIWDTGGVADPTANVNVFLNNAAVNAILFSYFYSSLLPQFRSIELTLSVDSKLPLTFVHSSNGGAGTGIGVSDVFVSAKRLI